jgi:thioredoxin-dependent peroxiredoxin
MPLIENTPAPDFSLPDQTGKLHKLSDYLGQWIILYFYPRDDTPGCTKEACGFRDKLPDLTGLNTVILGVSKDSVYSHTKFAQKYHLNFSILSDESKEVINHYGAWGTKKFMGKEFMGVKRISFLINPQGLIAKIYPSVNPLTHPGDIIKDIKNAQ